MFCVCLFVGQPATNFNFVFSCTVCVYCFYRPATGEIIHLFVRPAGNWPRVKYSALISPRVFSFRLRLTCWWQHFGASTGNTNPGSVRPSPPDIIRSDTIGRSAELNSLQPVVHHFVESARPAWQDPVYVSKLVDIVCIRVNWPVILSVE